MGPSNTGILLKDNSTNKQTPPQILNSSLILQKTAFCICSFAKRIRWEKLMHIAYCIAYFSHTAS